MSKTQNLDNLISKQDLAKALGLSTAKLSRLVNAGAITPALRITRKTMYFDISLVSSYKAVSNGK